VCVSVVVVCVCFDAVRLSREGPRPVARNFLATVGPSSSRTYREITV
jgi:hypothetical protein